jgi:hypothetical protein
MLVLVVLFGLTEWHARRQTPFVATESASGPVAGAIGQFPAVPVDDEPWALVSQLMADVASDELASADMPATLGSADRAIETLTEAEQAELTRLLKAELDAPGAVQ